jgi:hypothetical protein
MTSSGSITLCTAVGSASKLSSSSSVSLHLNSRLTHVTHLLIIVVIETKNRTLEETAALFDGEDATEKIGATAAHHAGVEHDFKDDDEKASH